MKVITGVTNVSSAGTRVQISNTSNRVRWVQFKALVGNGGLTYVGNEDVSASTGYELSAGNTVAWNFGEFLGSIPISKIYVDAATNGDKVSWITILDG